MKPKYLPQEFEEKWIDVWEKEQTYATPSKTSTEKKQYILDMFPYPSGAGLHVGHVEGYTATDIYSRYMRMNGKDVLHPMGWDSFGLPAENYAIKTGVHPKKSTDEAITNFITQIKRAGLSYDWKREIGSHREDYYKWTQWLFLLFYKKGLAYRKEATVNWCESCKTVLANEQVVNGLCERCDSPVIQKKMRQWFFKITDYAERLLTDLDKVDWPESTKAGQRNWIGKSEGAQIEFRVTSSELGIEVFTTRHDTAFGATFLVLAPDHPLVEQITTAEQRKEVDAYVTKTKQKTELQRQQDEKEKTGVFTGAYAVNPFTKEKIPVWIADYVLMSYGTGAVMAVPAHDERDFVFARKYGLEIRPVVAPVIDTDEELHSPEKTEKLRTVLYDICKIADTEKKQICLWGGWAVEILVGQAYRDHEDIDLHIRKDDIEWWKNTMKEKGFTIEKYPPEEETNEAFTFVAKKDDIIVDFEAIDIDDSNYVIWLDEEKPRSSEKKFDEMYELRAFDGIPVHTMGKETVKWWFMTDEGKSSQRWKDIYDLLMLRLHSYKGDGRIINSDFIDGLSVPEAKEKVIVHIEKEQIGQRKITYKLRDWLISRQRFWGAPIPIVYRKKEYNDIDTKILYSTPFKEMFSLAGNFYRQVLERSHVKCAALQNEKVYFTREGWNHILDQNKNKFDVLTRLFALPKIPYLLALAEKPVETKPRVLKKDGKTVRYWALQGIVDEVWTRVVVRSVNNGPKHVYSVIWKGESSSSAVKKAIKKSTVSCLYPQCQASLEQVKIAFSAFDHYTQWLDNNQDFVPASHAGSQQNDLETPIPVQADDLPVVLPLDAEFKPTGQSPLTDNADFQQVDTQKYPGATRREADTMDTFVDSSWYFLRFCDPHNTKEFASKEAMNTWGPVDLYMGGAEHTVLHLLYARFFTKVLYDEGYLTFDEPFLKLRHQGIILGPDHRKMSKRWGNVINPLDVCNEYGADTLRMYEMFMGPIDAMKPWNVKSVQGPYRFLTRVWKLYKSLELRVENRGTAVRARTDKTKDVKQDGNLNKELQSKLHKTIKKVTDDIPELKFNTAIAAMMEFVNEWEKAETRVENSEFGITDEDAKMFLQILAPFAPFMTEEIWREGYGEKHSIHLSPWPKYDTSLIVEETINLPVQVNGKMRGTLVISQKEAEDQDTVVKKAREDEKIAKFITGNPRKIIYVTGRILNIVAS